MPTHQGLTRLHQNIRLSSVARLALGAGVWLAGCAPANPIGLDYDALYGAAPDLSPLCTGNNDGVIDRSELLFPLGASVRYLLNPLGTTVTVDSEGKTGGADGPELDLSSSAGDVYEFQLIDVAQQWFAGSFPDATYAVLSDVGSGTLGIYRVTASSLLILGFASTDPNSTLIVYDKPVEALRFPVKVGQSWVTTAHITNGKIQNRPYAGADTYEVNVDEHAAVVLPYLRITGALRVRVNLTQAVPGGLAITHIQKLFYRECFGELGRIVSLPGEKNPAFTTAAEFRRLAL